MVENHEPIEKLVKYSRLSEETILKLQSVYYNKYNPYPY